MTNKPQTPLPLPDPPEREPDDMTSFPNLAKTGNVYLLTHYLVLSHLWNSSYREATCSAVPCKPMQHLPNPTFDFTVD